MECIWQELYKVRKLNHFGLVGRGESRQVPKYDKRHRAVHDMCKDDNDKEVATEEFIVVRSKILNFHSIKALIIAKSEITSAKE